MTGVFVALGLIFTLSACSSGSANDYQANNWAVTLDGGEVAKGEFTDEKLILEILNLKKRF